MKTKDQIKAKLDELQNKRVSISIGPEELIKTLQAVDYLEQALNHDEKWLRGKYDEMTKTLKYLETACGITVPQDYALISNTRWILGEILEIPKKDRSF